MNRDLIYEYYGRQKNDMEASVMPFVIFQRIEGETHIILISDGMLKLFDARRSEVTYVLENNIYTTVHPEDVDKVAAAWKEFVGETDKFNIVFRKLVHSKFLSILCKGESFLTDSGEKLYILWCSDVTDIVNAEKMNTYYDKLTNLPNMSTFGVLAEYERKRMHSRGIVPAFVYFDIREF